MWVKRSLKILLIVFYSSLSAHNFSLVEPVGWALPTDHLLHRQWCWWALPTLHFHFNVMQLDPRVVEIFGTNQPFQVLLRPDNYIGSISTAVSLADLKAYLRH